MAFSQMLAIRSWSNEFQCTLSAKDRGATKNPVVDLELILMHHFSRILRLSSLDLSSVLSTALNSYFRYLNNHSKVLKSVIYVPWSLPTVCIIEINFWSKIAMAPYYCFFFYTFLIRGEEVTYDSFFSGISSVDGRK